MTEVRFRWSKSAKKGKRVCAYVRPTPREQSPKGNGFDDILALISGNLFLPPPAPPQWVWSVLKPFGVLLVGVQQIPIIFRAPTQHEELNIIIIRNM